MICNEVEFSNHKDVRVTTVPSTDSCRKKNPDRKRFGARNQNKMQVLAKWILNNDQFRTLLFQQTIESGRTVHVLDVAGGKGELAARLALCHGMKVTMVDPRPANILNVFVSVVLPKLPNKWQNSIQNKLQTNPSFLSNSIDDRIQQLIMYFDERTTDNTASPTSCSINTTKQTNISSYNYPQDKGTDCEINTNDCKSNKRSGTLETEILQQAICECDLIIGMHADSATECIVDVALRHKKPFVIVPCCVFPSFFQQRFITIPSTPSSSSSAAEHDPLQSVQKVQVRNYDQFCEYLLQKDPRFRKDILNFKGRNVVIWWNGQ